MSLDIQNINVLNYNEYDVYVDTSREKYKFSASRDGEIPSIVPMPLNELQYIASNTNGIHTGLLTFDDEDKEEIFKLLRIPDWKKILTNEDIKRILLNPTIEELQQILDIDNQAYFDRIRVIMFKLISNGESITKKVSDIIDQRYNELKRKQRISSIVLKKKDEKKYVPYDEVKELTQQNNNLQQQINEMKKMMEKMMSNQSENQERAEISSPKTNTNTKRTTRSKKVES